jgi:hypothetical protein
MLARRVRELEQDLFWARAVLAHPLGSSDVARSGQGGEVSGEVDGTAFEVPGVRCSTSLEIAQTSATTAGDSETRNGSQEGDCVQAGVRV